MARKSCVICGQFFEARGNAKTCSPEHSKAERKRDLVVNARNETNRGPDSASSAARLFIRLLVRKPAPTEHWQEHLRAVRRAAVRRYQQSKEGQQARLRYEQSEKRRQTRRNYHQSELYRERSEAAGLTEPTLDKAPDGRSGPARREEVPRDGLPRETLSKAFF